MTRRLWPILLSVVAIAATGCDDLESQKGRPVTDKTIQQVLSEKTGEWMDIEGVIGTAIGLRDDRPCIKIFTSHDPAQVRARIPSAVEGYAVVIEQTGELRTRP
jgi:hypothetical protein